MFLTIRSDDDFRVPDVCLISTSLAVTMSQGFSVTELPQFVLQAPTHRPVKEHLSCRGLDVRDQNSISD